MSDSIDHIKSKSAAFFFQPTSIAPLVSFRILFGFLALISSIRFISEGWIEKLFIEPTFFFKYWGFSWITVCSPEQLYGAFYLMIFFSLLIIIGLFYRLAIVGFFLLFTYVDLIDATNYLNHHYLFSLLAFLLIFLPANARFSFDSLLFPNLKRSTIPSWCINILLFQISLVYLFAGIAKINTDWLVHAMPLAVWLPEHSHLPIIGKLLSFKMTAHIFSWAGMLYDCSIVFLLLNKHTRKFAFFAVLAFHGMTAILFNIGMFPYIMTACSLLFFPAIHHERLQSLFSRSIKASPVKTNSVLASKWVVAPLAIFILVQLVVPMRHHLYEGETAWTEEGYRFAWRVMLIEKSGQATFHVLNPETQQKDEVTNLWFLTDFQEKQMAIQPDFMQQYADHLAAHYESVYGWEDVEIYVDSHVALNGRVSRPLIKSNVNLRSQNGELPNEGLLLTYK